MAENVVRAIVVAAGRGSRMKGHTEGCPKCMIGFLGKPLISWQMDVLRASGIDDIAVVGGYKLEQLQSLNVPLRENKNWASTNMVHSLMCAEDLLVGGNDVLVGYGDIIYETKVVQKVLATPGDVVVAIDRDWLNLWRLRSDNPLDDAESLAMDDEGFIVDIGRKVESLAGIEGQYIGLILFRAKGIDSFLTFYRQACNGDDWLLGRTVEECYMTDLLRGMIDTGHRLKAALFNGGWLEFDTEQDLERYTILSERNKLDPFYKV